jgi:hypothetical protein
MTSDAYIQAMEQRLEAECTWGKRAEEKCRVESQKLEK